MDETKTISKAGSRFYVFPDGTSHPGITSIIGQLPKPFLVPWAAKMAAEWAIDNLTVVNDLAKRDPKAAVEIIKGASRRSTAGAANVGEEVHNAFEAMLHGRELPTLSEAAAKFVPHLEKFMADWEPKVILTEVAVRSDSVGYGGRLDAIVEIDGQTILLDLKSGKSVYPDVSLQLAAYRYCDTLADGSPMPHIDACAVLHVRPEGYKLHPVKADEEAFAIFKHLRASFDWEKLKSSHVGSSIKPEDRSGQL